MEYPLTVIGEISNPPLEGEKSTSVNVLANDFSEAVSRPAVTESTTENLFKKPSFIGPKKGPISDKVPTLQDSENGAATKKESKSEPPKKSFPQLPYSEPIWKGTTYDNYTLEVRSYLHTYVATLTYYPFLVILSLLLYQRLYL